jgi:MFS family permease
VRLLPWTLGPMLVAPVAGTLAARIGERPLLVSGLTLIAGSDIWFASIADASTDYWTILPTFVVGGIGCGLFWAPSVSIVFASVAEAEEGVASGANNSIRELGGVFGVAVLTSIFSGHGSFASPQDFVDGMTPAFYVGGVLVAIAAVTAFALPRRNHAVSMRPALAAGA